MNRPAPSPRPRGWTSRLRRVLLVVVLLAIGLPLLLLAGIYIALQTEAGRSTLVSVIEDAVSDETTRLSIGSLEGPLPQRLVLHKVILQEGGQKLLEVDRASLAWRPLSLFRRQLEIDHFVAGVVELHGLPEGQEEEESRPSEPLRIALPELPVSIDLKRLHVDDLMLGEAVAGISARLRIDGHAHIARDGTLDTRLGAERLDAGGGNLSAELALSAEGEDLTARIEGSEPRNGIVAELLDIADRPATSFSFAGEGPPEDWQGRLEWRAEDTARVTADVNLQGLSPFRLGVEGTAEAAALLPPDLRALATPEMTFAARLERAEDGTLSARGIRLTGPGAELTADAQLEADGESFTARADLALNDPTSLFPLIEPLTLRGAHAELSAEGTLSQPAASLRVQLTQPALPDLRTEELVLVADARASAPLHEENAGIDFTIRANGQSLGLADVALAKALAGEPHLEAAGRYSLAKKSLAVDDLTLVLAELSAQGSGELAFSGANPSGNLKLVMRHDDLQRLRDLAGLDLEGSFRVNAEAQLAEDGSMRATIDGLADRLQLGVPAADAMLGEQPGLVAHVVRHADGAMELEQLRVDASTTVLTGHAEAPPDLSRIDAGYQVAVSALEPLGDSLQQPLAGTLELAGTASGPLNSLEIAAQLQGRSLMLPGNPAQDLTADATVTLGEPGPRGSISLEGREGDYGPLSAGSSFALSDGSLMLSNLQARLGDAAEVSGQLDLPLDGRPGSGALQGDIPRLEALAAIAGIEAGGRLTMQARLSAEGNSQQLDGTLNASALRLGPAASPSVSGERLQLDFALRDLLAQPQVRANLRGEAIEAGPAQLTSLEASAAGGLASLQVTTRAEGEAAEEPLRLEAAANVGLLEEITRLSVQEFQADWAGESTRLLRPATLSLAPGDTQLQDLEAEIFGGRLAGGGRQEGEGIDLDLQLSDLPLTRLAALAGQTRTEGLLSAELQVSGQMSEPNANLQMLVDDFAFAEEAELQNRPPLDLRAQARLEGRSLRAEAELLGVGERPLALRAQVPVRVSLAPFDLTTLPGGPLDARLQWNGDLAPVMALMPVDTIRLAGNADMDLRAGGTLGSPQLSGQLSLLDARYENFTSGTLLDPLELVLAGSGDTLRLERLQAGDGADGQLNGSGSLVWRGGEALDADLQVDFKNMRMVQRDDVTARLTGELELLGNLFQRADLTGRITNDFIEVRLVDALPPSVAEIQVVEVREGQIPTQESDQEEAAAADSPLFLDINIDLPRRVFVRGRGLDSEWAGRFQVQGNAAAPQVSGALEPLRGEFVVIGKTFTLQEGMIELPAGAPDMDPLLDVSAVYSGEGFQATVHVTGTASQPEVSLSSQPSLPEDEILSRILFNKTSAELTPLEAVELADAAASLATGGPGMTALMRRALGVDVLSFRPGAQEGDPGAVEVGTYVSDRVYLGVEQGFGGSSTGVTVEVDITDQIKAHSDVGADGRSRAGVRWQMDY